MQGKKVKKFLQELQDLGFDAVHRDFVKLLKAERKNQGEGREILLKKLEDKFRTCKRCPLGESRINFVFGEGSAFSKVMFVGEGPGFEEDHRGKPFVGRAGALLTRIIENGMRIKREDVYITNIVKCHPMKDPSNPEKRGNDRPPTDEEVLKCSPILTEQIRIIKPLVICALGGPSARYFLKTDRGINSLRGKVYEINPVPQEPEYSVKLVPTYHPAYLLRNPSAKKLTWEDIKIVMKIIGLKTG
ncbi:MAG: uracil-DNA glycosylase [Elusimicrobia bacterium]|nr:uracil-DNA glycosylase [Elusimicrobiota bacterium]